MKPFFHKLIPSLIILFLFNITSCGDSINSELGKKLAGANKMKLYFFDKESGTVKDLKMVVTVSKQDDIKKIVESITDETAEQYKCGYSGQLEIFKDNDLLFNAEFNFEKECRHFVFRYNERMLFKIMSGEGSTLLKDYYDKAGGN